MANKTNVSTETKHEILDIEIRIDTEIKARIQAVKDEYTADISGIKETRDRHIKEIRAEKRTLMKEAIDNLVTDEEA